MRHLLRLSPLAAALSILLASSGAFAIRVQTGTDDITLNINFQLQPRVEFDWDGPPYQPSATGDYRASPSHGFNTDFYVRRARFIGSGVAYKRYTFYIMLDSSRLGQRNGATRDSAFVQDLYVGYIVAPDFNVELGFLYLPLSHAALASNSQTFAIEGVSDILQYNGGRGSRQAGVQVRGQLFDKRILIRGGAYEGARTAPTATVTSAAEINPRGVPMFAGIARLNLIGDEPGYSYPSVYLDGKTRVSVGVGAQYQSQGGGSKTATTFNDYLALAADVFADFALAADQEAAATLGIYRFDYGSGKKETGNGIHGEFGYRMGPIGPEVNFYWYNSDTRTNNSFKIAGGVNFFLEKHNAKIQAEFASLKNGVNLDTTPALHQILIQAQAAF